MTSGRCLALMSAVQLVAVELHAVEFAQQVVGELDVGLVDLVDQHHRRLLGLRRPATGRPDDVVADVLDRRIAQLRCRAGGDTASYSYRPCWALVGRFDVPLEQRHVQGAGHFLGEQGLAGAGFALDEQRALQGDGGITARVRSRVAT